MALPQTLSDFDALIKKHGSARKASEAIGVPRSTFGDAYRKAKTGAFTSRIHVDEILIPETDRPQYFIVTSAQDGTLPHFGFLNNLKAYAAHLSAELIISGFTYNKTLFEDHGKPGANFYRDLLPYMRNERILMGQELTVCCEMNTLPTAVNPLSGFHNYTGSRSGVFPHPKVQLESVPTMKGEPAKILQTTGCITKPNYVPKKAGIKAEYHHIIGALIIEIKTDGGYFARHVIADRDGDFYDLDIHVKDGEVTHGHFAEAITWGDIHRNKLDPLITAGCWGVVTAAKIFGRDSAEIDEIMHLPVFVNLEERMKPAYQFFHDILDFEVRNHHNIGNHFFLYKQFKKAATVEDEIDKVADFLTHVDRKYALSVVVESNHDLALEKWLRTADYKNDPANALFFLDGVRRLYQNIEDDDYSILADLLKERLPSNAGIIYLKEDDSFRICEWDKDGIECGLHGHNSLNGARPTPKSYTKLGVRCNTGHTHSASIYEGVYTAGITARLEHGYNTGASSWSHSHTITYKNGKRAIVTMDRIGRYTTLL